MGIVMDCINIPLTCIWYVPIEGEGSASKLRQETVDAA
jgi:hypothetical protein